jgi:hypothetical protein
LHVLERWGWFESLGAAATSEGCGIIISKLRKKRVKRTYTGPKKGQLVVGVCDPYHTRGCRRGHGGLRAHKRWCW